jgi:hypothetical protein
MKQTLEEARIGIIDRWITAHDEIGKFDEFVECTSNYKYGNIFDYDLKNYKNGNIAPSTKIHDEQQPNESSYGKYGFDEHGFLTTAEIYDKGQLTWIGFFTKTETLIEYIEFKIEHKAVSAVQRLLLNNGDKVLLQSASSNGRGTFYPYTDWSIGDKVWRGFNDGFSVVCTIEKYHYQDGKITFSDCLNIMPGSREIEYQNQYIYDNDKLVEIKTCYSDRKSAVTYKAPSGKSFKRLSDELAEMFCDYIISALEKQSFDSPLFSVELSYQYCYTYYPNPVVITGRQKDQALADGNNDLFTQGEFITIAENTNEELQKLYVEFYQCMEAADNFEAGRKMLIQTAKLLTSTKLKGCIPVTEDFIAFPMEWELEGGELKKILLKCGAPKAHVKQWQQYGWIWED